MSLITSVFANSDQPHSLGYAFRNKRMQYFEKLVANYHISDTPLTILDVGGEVNFWLKSSLLQNPNVQILVVNLALQQSPHPQIKASIADATNLVQFTNQSVDIVFSNSVIEHLYTWENQIKMAKECMRVGKKYFIQTPNRYFPIEAHYVLPWAQFYPKSFLFYCLTSTKLSRLRRWTKEEAKQYIEEIRLLSIKELKVLFPQATIYKEKFAGLSKSFTAHNF